MKSLAELRNAFSRNEPSESGGNNNNYYPFWQMDFGQSATVRFLPDKNEDNPLGFLVEKQFHSLEINGEKKKVPCMKMYDEDCPICKVSSDFYKEEDKINGKKYWRKRQYIAQALVVEDPIDVKEGEEPHLGQVRFISIGYQLYNAIKEAFESGELDEVPYSYKDGTNFIIKKTKQGDYATYAIGSRFVRKSTDLTDDEIEFVEDNMIDLSTLLPQKPDIEKVESMLSAALNGEEYDENDGESGDEKPFSNQTSTETSSKKEEEEPPFDVGEDKPSKSDDSSSESEFEDEADQILAKIRSRKNNK